MPVPEPLIEQLLALYDMQRPEWLRKGVTFRDSFAELLVSIFGQEIVLVDSLLPELRQAGAPLFQSLFARWNEVEDAIAASSRAMEEGGYAAQIEQRDGGRYTLLYRLDDNGERHIIEKPEDLGDPATISTSAMTRPLLQDFVLRPDVFVGGPAEVAYYAQQVGLHELLGVDMPRVALRGHALVAPKKLLRTLERYGISAGEVFGTPEEVLARDEPASVEEIRRIADDARRNLSKAMTRIGEIALPAEHAVARALNRSIGHIEYHFEKLTQRAIRALVRKDRERFAAVRELIANFYPERHVQERVVGWFPFWCQYGKHLVDSMINEIEPDSATFRMIGL